MIHHYNLAIIFFYFFAFQSYHFVALKLASFYVNLKYNFINIQVQKLQLKTNIYKFCQSFNRIYDAFCKLTQHMLFLD